MRLSANDIAVIRSLVHDRLGASAGIWLFGSRLDDAARGGTSTSTSNSPVRYATTCFWRVKRCGGS